MQGPGEHAVVLGGSVAGVLAARALCEGGHRVTVIDRDRLPGGPVTRAGVPQGRHAHVLPPRGQRLLEEMFRG